MPWTLCTNIKNSFVLLGGKFLVPGVWWVGNQLKTLTVKEKSPRTSGICKKREIATIVTLFVLLDFIRKLLLLIQIAGIFNAVNR